MACPAFVQNKKFRIVAAIVLLAIVSGVVYGLYLFNLKHSDLSKVKPAFILSASEFVSAFEKDEIASGAMYIGKVVEVSGVVADFSFSPSDSTRSITLRDEGRMSGVICTLGKDNEKVNVSAGQQVTIRGECSGFLMDVLLNNCSVVENRVGKE